MKECFLYDTRDRLVRAHTATITGTCATTTASTSTAAGTLAAYDTRWTFDDLGRTRTVRDMLAAATVTYNYTTTRHAITSLTGAATAAYTYNPVGAMTTRNTTALGYDAMQRLTSYGSVDTNLYRASNQRLIRTSSTTRTLYVPGMDVTVSAGVRTITRTLTIDGTPYGTRTHTSGTTATMWNCTNPQHTLTCTTPAGSTSIPPRTRYTPYGTPRTTTTITNTDRGHLNQPHDPTGLTYLNNRYYDPTLNAFTTVDPLVAKTGTPYLYAGGNPTTFSDPTGLDRCDNPNGSGRCVGRDTPGLVGGGCSDSQYNRGCTVDEDFPVGTGPRSVRFMVDRINDNIDLDLTRGARAHNYPCAACEKRDSQIWLAEEAEFFLLIYDYYKTNSEGDLKSGVRQVIGKGTDAVQIAEGKYVRFDVLGNVFFGFAMHQSGYTEGQALDFSHGTACNGGLCLQKVGDDVGETDASDDISVSIGWDWCNCGREHSSHGVTMTQAQEVLLANFDALLAVGGACLRPEDCSISG